MGMTSEQAASLYRRSGIAVPKELHGEPEIKRHKYNARKKEVDGIMFDSTSEAEAYRILKLWEKSGAITDLELQPVFLLQEKFVTASVDGPRKTHRAVKMIADFQFRYNGFSFLTVVDVKGIQTPVFRIKEKLFRQKFQDRVLQIWDRNKVRELSRA